MCGNSGVNWHQDCQQRISRNQNKKISNQWTGWLKSPHTGFEQLTPKTCIHTSPMQIRLATPALDDSDLPSLLPYCLANVLCQCQRVFFPAAVCIGYSRRYHISHPQRSTLKTDKDQKIFPQQKIGERSFKKKKTRALFKIHITLLQFLAVSLRIDGIIYLFQI